MSNPAGVPKKKIQRIARQYGVRLKREPNELLLTPLNEVSYVLFDTELTGLDERQDCVVSVGAIRMHGSRIELGDAFYKLVCPPNRVTSESVAIHGLRPLDLATKPAMGTVLPDFLDFCGSDVLVGFMPSIDVDFLNKEAQRIVGKPLHNRVVDIFAVYDWLRRRINIDCTDQPSLYELAKALNVRVKNAHNALSDAFITGQVFQRFLFLLTSVDVVTLGQLLDLGDLARGGERLRLMSRNNNL